MTGGNNTRSPFDPSRFVYEESSRRPSNGSKAVRFQSGEASFSEHMSPNNEHQQYRGIPRATVGLSPTTPATTHIALGVLFSLLAIIIVMPPSVADIARLTVTRYAGAKHMLCTAIWPQGRDLTPPEFANALTPSSIENLARDAALLARWGPILRPDFALQANGARIDQDLTSRPEIARSRAPTPSVGPEVVLDEELTIGRCWSVPVTGQVGFSTETLIHPQHVVVDHIPRQIALDINRAPRRMVLWGVIDGLSNIRRFDSLRIRHPDLQLPFDLTPRGRTWPKLTGNHAFVALAAFEYNIHNDSSQAFPVFDHIALSEMDFGVYVLEIVDNWGGSDTCLYRVRIHGEPAAIGK